MTNSLKSLMVASALLVSGAEAALALPPWTVGGHLGSDPTAELQQQEQQQRNRAIVSWQPQRQAWSTEIAGQPRAIQMTRQSGGSEVR
ncbi:MAG: hypothetical protein JO227_21330 [Acetobacteraceae bacterium]|nr:hypothetical protein [Acetobacteraceae bacterium]